MDTRAALKRYFGHDDFRPGQEALTGAILSGRDALGVMPTGAGKSICFQLPALLMPGLTLVISPLISLMKDQVSSLKQAGVGAAYINSSLTPAQNAEALRRASLLYYKIIYVAPERLDAPDFLRFAQTAPIDLVTVDEAHCVSQWGQDFRPSYLRIADFIEKLDRRPPVAAFTATATPAVKRDIVQSLRLRDPLAVTTGYDRPNLHFSVLKPKDKYGALVKILQKHPGACAIVYCSTRKTVEEVCSRLKSDGYAATRYHAGLTDAERKANQDDFQFDRAQIMVATNAFGMGIDKSNVTVVAHYNMPKDLESYYQEAGRAGRDGGEAECALLYGGRDVMTCRWMIEHAEINTDLTESERAEIRLRDLERLRQMTFYSTSKRCLRAFILRYFGERAPETCGNCSVCEGAAFEEALERAAHTARDKKEKTTDDPLFLRLKALRGQLAKERGIPAYVIFTDAALRDMAVKKPRTPDEFIKVSGVGEAKRRQYGAMFLREIESVRDEDE